MKLLDIPDRKVQTAGTLGLSRLVQVVAAKCDDDEQDAQWNA
jgi:hypothetical protein